MHRGLEVELCGEHLKIKLNANVNFQCTLFYLCCLYVFLIESIIATVPFAALLAALHQFCDSFLHSVLNNSAFYLLLYDSVTEKRKSYWDIAMIDKFCPVKALWFPENLGSIWRLEYCVDYEWLPLASQGIEDHIFNIEHCTRYLLFIKLLLMLESCLEWAIITLEFILKGPQLFHLWK